MVLTMGNRKFLAQTLVAVLISLATIVGLAATSAHAAGEEPVTVHVGAYAMTIQELDQQNNSFYADFYLWFRWDGKDLDPSASMEFVNNLERWGLTQNPVFEEPKLLPSGEYTQQYHVQGKFFSALQLTDYPLDSHRLSIDMEDTQSTDAGLVYVADSAQSGRDAGLKIPGWTITGSDLTVSPHTYTTNFGEAVGEQDTYSRASFGITIERPRNFFIWKLMLPLLIVVLIALSILVVHPSMIEVRLGAPATALLALVFLQQAYTSTLPETGNLVLLDKIYVLSYALVVALMLVTILTSHWTRDGGIEGTARAIRLDRVAELALFAAFVVGVSFLILTR
jgi:hypothetical protein